MMLLPQIQFAFRRVTISAAVLLLLATAISPEVFAQGADKGSDISKPEAQALTTTDGFPIVITYFKSNGGKETPVVVLLHMKEDSRRIWDSGLAPILQKEGYAVITVDLRGHGESKGEGIPATSTTTTGNVNQKKKDEKEKKPTPKAGKGSGDIKKGDVEAMIEFDMEAVKNFLYERHQAQELNMNKLAVVGPEMGATIAMNFAARDWAKKPHSDGQPGFQTPRGQDVRAVVLISPQTGFAGIPVNAAINEMRASYPTTVDPNGGVAFLVCVSKKDADDHGQAKKIFDLIQNKQNSDRTYFESYEGKLRGTQMLGKNLKIEAHIMAFLDKHLRKLPPNWRDRQSKLEKKTTTK